MDSVYKKIMFVLAVICLTLACATGAVLAQQFKQGSTYVEARGGAYGTTNENVNVIATYGGAFGYYALNNVAIEAEGLGYYVDQNKKAVTANGETSKNDQANGGGLNVIAKWHMVATPQASLYVGAGGGGVWTNNNIAYNGDKNNWTGLGEMGMTVSLSNSVNLRAAGRYQHIGAFADSGINALGGNLGLNFSF